MTKYVLSPLAQADIEDIWDYTEAHWGTDQAEAYVGRINDAMNALSSNPGLGRPCGDIRPGYHKYPAGSHILFYRLVDDLIDIVRVLHQQMDYPRHL